MLEISRVVGQLMREGWRPRRTVIFASWGAEEFGLIGSTEWVEVSNTSFIGSFGSNAKEPMQS